MKPRAFRVKIERVPEGFSPNPEFYARIWSVYVFGFPDAKDRAYYFTFSEALEYAGRYINAVQRKSNPITGIGFIGGIAYQVRNDVLKKNRPYKHSMDAGQLKAQRRKRAARIRAGKKAQREAEDRLDRIIVAVARKEAERMYLTPEDVSIPSTWWHQAKKIREKYLH